MLLPACAGLGGGKELATYDLSAPVNLEKIPGRTNSQILVPTPTALKSLDSEMIVVRPSASEITYLGDAQWSDRLPKVVQDKLIQTFENSGRIRSVTKPGDGVVVDYKIVAQIRHFELVTAKGNHAIVELSVKIINDRTGRVRASRIFEATAPASTFSPSDGVKALDQASDQALREILAWVVDVL